MSGGSYGYLYSKRILDLPEGIYELVRMARDLRQEYGPKAGLGDDHPIYDRYDRAVALMREIDAELDALEKVTHAVEWIASGDWGPEALREAVEACTARPRT
jgi:hypothetical protein